MPEVGPIQPGLGVLGRELANLFRRLLVVVPQPDGAPVGKRVQAARVQRIDVEPVVAKLQLVDHLLLEDVAHVGAGGDVEAGTTPRSRLRRPRRRAVPAPARPARPGRDTRRPPARYARRRRLRLSCSRPWLTPSPASPEADRRVLWLPSQTVAGRLRPCHRKRRRSSRPFAAATGLESHAVRGASRSL